MKKRKTYEISVIDKTYSKTISDETKFYTSDTALELRFELKETDYVFESAEIVLLNIDDRSLVTRPVTKSLDSFAYELDDDITTHYGEWQGQLRFEQAGEIYVSSPVKFRIENDLSNERPPQLSDVQSWVSLKRYADSLTEELKQAVLSIEGAEDTFNENETARQNQFETAEQSRQTTFEANEIERDETFNINENARQTQELEREKAEGQRQSVFDNNEVNRAETFNANEATRQENETTRQQAEAQRASAESARVSAEEQRKIDHANRSAELDSKADKVVLNNLVENGDFSEGILGWNTAILSLTNQEYHTPPNSFYKPSATLALYRNVPLPNNHVTYLSAFVKGTSKMELRMNEFDTWTRIRTERIDSSNEWTLLSTTGLSANGGIRIDTSVDDGDNYYDDFIVIDLTTTFGAGNEPTKEEMDELIKVIGYIDGEYALNNKEMMGHLMKGIGDKANKKQEDWIKPTLLNGWVLHDVAPKYMKDDMGFVHLKGNVKGGPLYTTIFTLPVGYRPNSETIRVPLGGDAYGRATIVLSGAVSITVGSGALALDGITFRAEA